MFTFLVLSLYAPVVVLYLEQTHRQVSSVHMCLSTTLSDSLDLKDRSKHRNLLSKEEAN